MSSKNYLRSKFLKLRKKNYFSLKQEFFNPLNKLIKKIYKKNRQVKLGIFYPSNFEVNILKILDNDISKKLKIYLPKIKKNYQMEFYAWKKNDVLEVNEYGIPEPVSENKKCFPDVILLPLIAYDKYKNRLGYGKGFYDRYLDSYFKKKIKNLTIGVAFSFQKYKKIPVTKTDVKLDYILTEKGLF